jgi:ribosomal protein S18 acetylase RimI-like enzyme
MFVYRSAQPSDVGRMAEMNCRLARETEGKELDEVMVLAGVRRGLELAPEVRYFVAESHSGIVGQVMITREWSDWRNGWMVWLQSVYVDADYRGRGIFRRLLNHAVEAARAEGDVVCIRLYVEHENQSAQSVYRRLGFDSAGYEVLEMRVERD